MGIYRATFKGNLGDTDIFMFGFALEADSNPVDIWTAVAVSAEEQFEGLWGGGVIFTGLRIDEITEATGVVADTYEGSVSIAQGGGGVMLPSEVAMCVTIRTVGTSGVKGRFYLPPPTASRCATNGRIEATYQASVSDALQAMFQDDLGAASTPMRLGVYSRKNHAYVGAARHELGNVFDSQRRRRNKLVESRVGHNIA